MRLLTDETEAGLGQVRPFKDGVEDVLSFTVQLVHLVQNEEPGDEFYWFSGDCSK